MAELPTDPETMRAVLKTVRSSVPDSLRSEALEDNESPSGIAWNAEGVRTTRALSSELPRQCASHNRRRATSRAVPEAGPAHDCRRRIGSTFEKQYAMIRSAAATAFVADNLVCGHG